MEDYDPACPTEDDFPIPEIDLSQVPLPPSLPQKSKDSGSHGPSSKQRSQNAPPPPLEPPVEERRAGKKKKKKKKKGQSRTRSVAEDYDEEEDGYGDVDQDHNGQNRRKSSPEDTKHQERYDEGHNKGGGRHQLGKHRDDDKQKGQGKIQDDAMLPPPPIEPSEADVQVKNVIGDEEKEEGSVSKEEEEEEPVISADDSGKRKPPPPPPPVSTPKPAAVPKLQFKLKTDPESGKAKVSFNLTKSLRRGALKKTESQDKDERVDKKDIVNNDGDDESLTKSGAVDDEEAAILGKTAGGEVLATRFKVAKKYEMFRPDMLEDPIMLEFPTAAKSIVSTPVVAKVKYDSPAAAAAAAAAAAVNAALAFAEFPSTITNPMVNSDKMGSLIPGVERKEDEDRSVGVENRDEKITDKERLDETDEKKDADEKRDEKEEGGGKRRERERESDKERNINRKIRHTSRERDSGRNSWEDDRNRRRDESDRRDKDQSDHYSKRRERDYYGNGRGGRSSRRSRSGSRGRGRSGSRSPEYRGGSKRSERTERSRSRGNDKGESDRRKDEEKDRSRDGKGRENEKERKEREKKNLEEKEGRKLQSNLEESDGESKRMTKEGRVGVKLDEKDERRRRKLTEDNEEVVKPNDQDEKQERGKQAKKEECANEKEADKQESVELDEEGKIKSDKEMEKDGLVSTECLELKYKSKKERKSRSEEDREKGRKLDKERKSKYVEEREGREKGDREERKELKEDGEMRENSDRKGESVEEVLFSDSKQRHKMDRERKKTAAEEGEKREKNSKEGKGTSEEGLEMREDSENESGKVVSSESKELSSNLDVDSKKLEEKSQRVDGKTETGEIVYSEPAECRYNPDQESKSRLEEEKVDRLNEERDHKESRNEHDTERKNKSEEERGMRDRTGKERKSRREDDDEERDRLGEKNVSDRRNSKCNKDKEETRGRREDFDDTVQKGQSSSEDEMREGKVKDKKKKEGKILDGEKEEERRGGLTRSSSESKPEGMKKECREPLKRLDKDKREGGADSRQKKDKRDDYERSSKFSKRRDDSAEKEVTERNYDGQSSRKNKRSGKVKSRSSGSDSDEGESRESERSKDRKKHSGKDKSRDSLRARSRSLSPNVKGKSRRDVVREDSVEKDRRPSSREEKRPSSREERRPGSRSSRRNEDEKDEDFSDSDYRNKTYGRRGQRRGSRSRSRSPDRSRKDFRYSKSDNIQSKDEPRKKTRDEEEAAPVALSEVFVDLSAIPGKSKWEMDDEEEETTPAGVVDIDEIRDERDRPQRYLPRPIMSSRDLERVQGLKMNIPQTRRGERVSRWSAPFGGERNRSWDEEEPREFRERMPRHKDEKKRQKREEEEKSFADDRVEKDVNDDALDNKLSNKDRKAMEKEGGGESSKNDVKGREEAKKSAKRDSRPSKAVRKDNSKSEWSPKSDDFDIDKRDSNDTTAVIPPGEDKLQDESQQTTGEEKLSKNVASQEEPVQQKTSDKENMKSEKTKTKPSPSITIAEGHVDSVDDNDKFSKLQPKSKKSKKEKKKDRIYDVDNNSSKGSKSRDSSPVSKTSASKGSKSRDSSPISKTSASKGTKSRDSSPVSTTSASKGSKSRDSSPGSKISKGKNQDKRRRSRSLDIEEVDSTLSMDRRERSVSKSSQLSRDRVRRSKSLDREEVRSNSSRLSQGSRDKRRGSPQSSPKRKGLRRSRSRSVEKVRKRSRSIERRRQISPSFDRDRRVSRRRSKSLEKSDLRGVRSYKKSKSPSPYRRRYGKRGRSRSNSLDDGNRRDRSKSRDKGGVSRLAYSPGREKSRKSKKGRRKSFSRSPSLIEIIDDISSPIKKNRPKDSGSPLLIEIIDDLSPQDMKTTQRKGSRSVTEGSEDVGKSKKKNRGESKDEKKEKKQKEVEEVGSIPMPGEIPSLPPSQSEKGKKKQRVVEEEEERREKDDLATVEMDISDGDDDNDNVAEIDKERGDNESLVREGKDCNKDNKEKESKEKTGVSSELSKSSNKSLERTTSGRKNSKTTEIENKTGSCQIKFSIGGGSNKKQLKPVLQTSGLLDDDDEDDEESVKEKRKHNLSLLGAYCDEDNDMSQEKARLLEEEMGGKESVSKFPLKMSKAMTDLTVLTMKQDECKNEKQDVKEFKEAGMKLKLETDNLRIDDMVKEAKDEASVDDDEESFVSKEDEKAKPQQPEPPKRLKFKYIPLWEMEGEKRPSPKREELPELSKTPVSLGIDYDSDSSTNGENDRSTPRTTPVKKSPRKGSPRKESKLEDDKVTMSIGVDAEKIQTDEPKKEKRMEDDRLDKGFGESESVDGKGQEEEVRLSDTGMVAMSIDKVKDFDESPNSLESSYPTKSETLCEKTAATAPVTSDEYSPSHPSQEDDLDLDTNPSPQIVGEKDHVTSDVSSTTTVTSPKPVTMPDGTGKTFVTLPQPPQSSDRCPDSSDGMMMLSKGGMALPSIVPPPSSASLSPPPTTTTTPPKMSSSFILPESLTWGSPASKSSSSLGGVVPLVFNLGPSPVPPPSLVPPATLPVPPMPVAQPPLPVPPLPVPPATQPVPPLPVPPPAAAIPTGINQSASNWGGPATSTKAVSSSTPSGNTAALLEAVAAATAALTAMQATTQPYSSSSSTSGNYSSSSSSSTTTTTTRMCQQTDTPDNNPAIQKRPRFSANLSRSNPSSDDQRKPVDQSPDKTKEQLQMSHGRIRHPVDETSQTQFVKSGKDNDTDKPLQVLTPELSSKSPKDKTEVSIYPSLFDLADIPLPGEVKAPKATPSATSVDNPKPLTEEKDGKNETPSKPQQGTDPLLVKVVESAVSSTAIDKSTDIQDENSSSSSTSSSSTNLPAVSLPSSTNSLQTSNSSSSLDKKKRFVQSPLAIGLLPKIQPQTQSPLSIGPLPKLAPVTKEASSGVSVSSGIAKAQPEKKAGGGPLLSRIHMVLKNKVSSVSKTVASVFEDDGSDSDRETALEKTSFQPLSFDDDDEPGPPPPPPLPPLVESLPKAAYESLPGVTIGTIVSSSSHVNLEIGSAGAGVPVHQAVAVPTMETEIETYPVKVITSVREGEERAREDYLSVKGKDKQEGFEERSEDNSRERGKRDDKESRRDSREEEGRSRKKGRLDEKDPKKKDQGKDVEFDLSKVKKEKEDGYGENVKEQKKTDEGKKEKSKHTYDTDREKDRHSERRNRDGQSDDRRKRRYDDDGSNAQRRGYGTDRDGERGGYERDRPRDWDSRSRDRDRKRSRDRSRERDDRKSDRLGKRSRHSRDRSKSRSPSRRGMKGRDRYDRSRERDYVIDRSRSRDLAYERDRSRSRERDFMRNRSRSGSRDFDRNRSRSLSRDRSRSRERKVPKRKSGKSAKEDFLEEVSKIDAAYSSQGKGDGHKFDHPPATVSAESVSQQSYFPPDSSGDSGMYSKSSMDYSSGRLPVDQNYPSGEISAYPGVPGFEGRQAPNQQPVQQCPPPQHYDNQWPPLPQQPPLPPHEQYNPGPPPPQYPPGGLSMDGHYPLPPHHQPPQHHHHHQQQQQQQPPPPSHLVQQQQHAPSPQQMLFPPSHGGPPPPLPPPPTSQFPPHPQQQHYHNQHHHHPSGPVLPPHYIPLPDTLPPPPLPQQQYHGVPPPQSNGPPPQFQHQFNPPLPSNQQTDFNQPIPPGPNQFQPRLPPPLPNQGIQGQPPCPPASHSYNFMVQNKGTPPGTPPVIPRSPPVTSSSGGAEFITPQVGSTTTTTNANAIAKPSRFSGLSNAKIDGKPRRKSRFSSPLRSPTAFTGSSDDSPSNVTVSVGGSKDETSSAQLQSNSNQGDQSYSNVIAASVDAVVRSLAEATEKSSSNSSSSVSSKAEERSSSRRSEKEDRKKSLEDAAAMESMVSSSGVEDIQPDTESDSGTETLNKPLKVKSRWRRNSEAEAIADTSSSTVSTLDTTSLQSSSSNVQQGLESTTVSELKALTEHIKRLKDQMERHEEAQAKEQAGGDQGGNAKDDSPEEEKEEEEEDLNSLMKRPDFPKFEIITENIHLTERKKSKSMKRMLCDCTTSREDRSNDVPACGSDCLNRMLMIECGYRCPCGDHCTNRRFQKKQYSKTIPMKSGDKGWGLQAMEDMPEPSTFVMEYVGELLDYEEFVRRTRQYSKMGMQHHYFMALNADEVVDATLKGSISRFINHSCDPNCETQKWTVNGELRVGFFTRKPIKKGEELNFDYQFEHYGEAQKCYCGAEKCRGYIGLVKSPTKVTTSKKKDKKKKAIFKDELLEDDISQLSQLDGMRNKNHVLELCRVMVRAEKVQHRTAILKILQSTKEPACLRLFLDYHGLPLFWSWMTDINTADYSDDTEEFKILMLSVLKALPITNKTVLKESKILPVVERWAFAAVAAARKPPPPPPTSTTTSSSSSSSTSSSNTDSLTETSTADVEAAVVTATSTADSDEAAATTTENEAESLSQVVPPASSSSSSPPPPSSSPPPPSTSPPLVFAPLPVSNLTPVSILSNAEKSKDGRKKRRVTFAEEHIEASFSPEPDDETSGISSSSTPYEQCHGEAAPLKDPTLSQADDEGEENEGTNSTSRVAGEADSTSQKEAQDDGVGPSGSDTDTSDVEYLTKDPLTSLASELLCSWSGLKEIFKIPKKERVEERKRTERELDVLSKKETGTRTDPYAKWKKKSVRSTRKRSFDEEERKSNVPKMSKEEREERRQRFEAQVKAEDELAAQAAAEEMQRQQEEFMLHQKRLMEDPQYFYFHQQQQDPNFVGPMDETPQPVLDPVTGQPMIDPVTGQPILQPFIDPHSGQAIDPHTGQALTPQLDPVTGQSIIDPVTGQPVYQVQEHLHHHHHHPDPSSIDPNTGQPLEHIDPNTAQPWIDPNNTIQTFVDPNTGQPLIDPNTGTPLIDPNTGQPFMDPNTGQPFIDPNTGQPFIDPNAGQQHFIDPNTGTPLMDPNTGQPMHAGELDPNSVLPPFHIPIDPHTAQQSSQTVHPSNVQAMEAQVLDPVAGLHHQHYLPTQQQHLGDQTIQNVGMSAATSQAFPPKVRSDPMASGGNASVEEEVPPPPSPPSVPVTKLPPNWKTAKDAEGRVYYYHAFTRQTQWEMPTWEDNINDSDNDMELDPLPQDDLIIKSSKRKTTTAAADTSSELAKKYKEQFRTKMSGFIVLCLNPFRKPDCKLGRINTTEDFKYLARKLTHHVLSKELKHCRHVEDLEVNENVKAKAKDYVRKYMSKFGSIYRRTGSPQSEDFGK